VALADESSGTERGEGEKDTGEAAEEESGRDSGALANEADDGVANWRGTAKNEGVQAHNASAVSVVAVDLKQGVDGADKDDHRGAGEDEQKGGGREATSERQKHLKQAEAKSSEINEFFTRTVAAQVDHNGGAGERARTERRHQQSVATRIEVEVLLRKNRHDDIEIDGKNAHEEKEQEGAKKETVLLDIEEAFFDALEDGSGGGVSRGATGGKGADGKDDRNESEGIQNEDPSDMSDRDKGSSDRGTEDAGNVEDRGIECNRVHHEVFALYHFANEGLSSGHIQSVRETEAERQERNVPVLNDIRKGEDAEKDGLEGEERLGDDQEAALGDTINEGASEERKEKHRRKLERSNNAQCEGRFRKFEHEPRLSGGLHPGASQGQQLRRPVEAEIANGERRHHFQELTRRPLTEISSVVRGFRAVQSGHFQDFLPLPALPTKSILRADAPEPFYSVRPRGMVGSAAKVGAMRFVKFFQSSDLQGARECGEMVS
jgi:hypothetical protein